MTTKKNHSLIGLKIRSFKNKIQKLNNDIPQIQSFFFLTLFHSIYWILHLPTYKRTSIRINFSYKLKARAVNAGSRLQKKFLNKIQKLGPRCRTVHFCGRYAWDLEVNSMHPSFELDLSDILSGRGKDPISANLSIQNRVFRLGHTKDSAFHDNFKKILKKMAPWIFKENFMLTRECK